MLSITHHSRVTTIDPQMVGTWGQLLFPKSWKEFRLWYDEHKAEGSRLLQGMEAFFFFLRNVYVLLQLVVME